MRLSETQERALRTIDQWSDETGVYMPLRVEARTFESLERMGLVEYLRVDQGHRHNGYRRKKLSPGAKS